MSSYSFLLCINIGVINREDDADHILHPSFFPTLHQFSPAKLVADRNYKKKRRILTWYALSKKHNYKDRHEIKRYQRQKSNVFVLDFVRMTNLFLFLSQNMNNFWRKSSNSFTNWFIISRQRNDTIQEHSVEYENWVISWCIS